jgi:hypothetical protein
VVRLCLLAAGGPNQQHDQQSRRCKQRSGSADQDAAGSAHRESVYPVAFAASF